MADKNTGLPLKWELAGSLEIGASNDNLLWVEEGSMQFKSPGREGISLMDRGDLKARVISGNQRHDTLTFQIRPTQNGMQGASDLYALLKPADTNGEKTLYSVRVKIPNYPGATAGTLVTFASCWCPDGLDYQSRGGNQVDLISVSLQSEGGITKTTY